MTTKRKPPAELVSRSVSRPYKRRTWLDRLDARDRKYVRAVALEMRKNRDAAPYLIADALIDTLSLSACRTTVASTLKEIRDEKK